MYLEAIEVLNAAIKDIFSTSAAEKIAIFSREHWLLGFTNEPIKKRYCFFLITLLYGIVLRSYGKLHTRIRSTATHMLSHSLYEIVINAQNQF